MRIPLLVCAVLSIAVIFGAAPGTASAATAYDGANLIDDSIFLNTSTMSAGSIQAFLAGKGSGLASYSVNFDCASTGAASNNAYVAAGAPCGQTVRASVVIYYASQVYGINPQVILATLQKEQSLVTDPSPSTWQYQQALGYGCPDSGGCGASTFLYQIDNGVWVLRFNYERANGNLNYWFTSTSWVCGSPKNYYKPSLYPGQNVSFYDGTGTMYRTYWLADPSSASLYCYTPHAYNNPQGLYGLLAFGTTGQYYSGSYNFVQYFNNWFGDSYVPATAANYSQTPAISLADGQSGVVAFRYKNTGNVTWRDDINANGGPAVHLATAMPVNRQSSFAATWPSPARPKVAFTKVYTADGVTLATDQHAVQPGQIAEYGVTLTVPVSMPPGAYNEAFQPVRDGAIAWDMQAVSSTVITVLPTYKASLYSQSNNTLAGFQNSTAGTAQLKFMNTGAGAWYDAQSAAAGAPQVHLATANPVNRSSNFSASWPAPQRPNVTFSAVYEADGVTLAANQHVVQPGQIAEYDVGFAVPDSIGWNTYNEIFKPVADGSNQWDMSASATVTVRVNAVVHKAAYYSQGSYLTLAQGATGSSFVEFQNVGNSVWYDDTSAVAGVLPVHLATDVPVNRASTTTYNWVNNARPNVTFSAVYEADGVTLAANQHVVQPGQLARFTMSFKNYGLTHNQIAREYFMPVLEGSSRWNMTSQQAWLDVTGQ